MAKAPKPPRDCPCHSGLRYAECCGPAHRGERAPGSPEALMRSRYAAFALGLGEYLVRTLAEGHEDLALPREPLIRELSRQKDNLRYMGLDILHASSGGDEGEVVFHARIFEKGKSRGFVELSRFVRQAGAWRYLDGTPIPEDALPAGTTALRPEELRALAATLDDA